MPGSCWRRTCFRPDAPTSSPTWITGWSGAKTGDYLIRQDDPPKGIYFIEEGEVSVWRQVEGGQRIRLRQAGPGTVMGEVGVYLGTLASADVVADGPGLVRFVSIESLAHLEREHPEVAATCHRWIASVLSTKLLDSLKTIDALMR